MITIRRAVAADAKELTALYHDAFSIWKEKGLSFGPMYQKEEATAAQIEGRVFVAVDEGGRIVGSVGIAENGAWPGISPARASASAWSRTARRSRAPKASSASSLKRAPRPRGSYRYPDMKTDTLLGRGSRLSMPYSAVSVTSPLQK